MDQANPTPGSEEYNRMMSDKFLNAEEDETDKPDRVPSADMPEDGHEKYYDPATGVYNWEAHAKELLFNSRGRNDPVKKTEEVPEKASEDEQQVESVIERAGLNTEALGAKIISDGDLSPDDYLALKAVGIPEDLIKSYVQSYRYQYDTEMKSALEFVGGEDKWQETISWASANLSEQEVNDFNSILGTPAWRLAVDGIRARMGDTRTTIREPTMVRGDVRTGSTSGYRSKAEMKADMAHKEYTTSPKFREDVMKKLQSATWDLDM